VALARRTIEDAGLQERIGLRHADTNALADTAAHGLVMMNIVLYETGAQWTIAMCCVAAGRPCDQGGP
jgi:hypothetical protein